MHNLKAFLIMSRCLEAVNMSTSQKEHSTSEKVLDDGNWKMMAHSPRWSDCCVSGN